MFTLQEIQNVQLGNSVQTIEEQVVALRDRRIAASSIQLGVITPHPSQEGFPELESQHLLNHFGGVQLPAILDFAQRHVLGKWVVTYLAEKMEAEAYQSGVGFHTYVTHRKRAAPIYKINLAFSLEGFVIPVLTVSFTSNHRHAFLIRGRHAAEQDFANIQPFIKEQSCIPLRSLVDNSNWLVSTIYTQFAFDPDHNRLVSEQIPNIIARVRLADVRPESAERLQAAAGAGAAFIPQFQGVLAAANIQGERQPQHVLGPVVNPGFFN